MGNGELPAVNANVAVLEPARIAADVAIDALEKSVRNSSTVPPAGLVIPLPVTLTTMLTAAPSAADAVLAPVNVTVGVTCVTTAFWGGDESESAAATLPFVAFPLNRAIIEYVPAVGNGAAPVAIAVKVAVFPDTDAVAIAVVPVEPM